MRLYSGGTYYFHSKTNKEWRVSDHVELFSCIGDDEWVKRKLEELKSKYGEPPEDLVYGTCKY